MIPSWPQKFTMILRIHLYYISDPMVCSSRCYFVHLILSCKQQKRCTPTQGRQIKRKIATAIHHSISQHKPKEPERLFCVSLDKLYQGYVTVFCKPAIRCTPPILYLSMFVLLVTRRLTL